MEQQEAVKSRVFARVGILGNPSDAFGGAAVAAAISNYSAVVEFTRNTCIEVVPNATHDRKEFEDLERLSWYVKKFGYYGGQRLILATCMRFEQESKRRKLTLHEQCFKVTYETNIPRQTGLSGSSAIVTATFNCLLKWYGLEGNWPMPERPTFVLDVEKEELGITAGLMDRVAQVYGGLTYVNCADASAPVVERLPGNRLPELWLMHASVPSSSEVVHAPVRTRWEAGDEALVSGMRHLAELANTAREQLTGDAGVSTADLGSMMDQNFNLRRGMYGDEALGGTNIEMVECARSVGAAAKFCGSGGAILVCCPGGEQQVVSLIEKCEEKRYVIERISLVDSMCSDAMS